MPLTEREVHVLERMELDYQDVVRVRDREFLERYGIRREIYGKQRDAIRSLLFTDRRLKEKIFEDIERTNGTMDVNRHRMREQAAADFERGLNAVRASPAGAAFLLIARSRGANVKQMADAAELGQAAGNLAGGAVSARAAVRSRQTTTRYEGSAGLTVYRDQAHVPTPEARGTGSRGTEARLRPEPPPPPQPAPDQELEWQRRGNAEYESFLKEFPEARRAGERIQLGEHGGATRNRAVLGLSGRAYESAHGAPQSVMRQVTGYRPEVALTVLLARANHRGLYGMDHFWKRDFDAMRKARPNKKATAQEIYEVVARAIDRTPGLRPGEKKSMIARLHDEMFVDHGLHPDHVFDIPRGYTH